MGVTATSCSSGLFLCWSIRDVHNAFGNPLLWDRIHSFDNLFGHLRHNGVSDHTREDNIQWDTTLNSNAVSREMQDGHRIGSSYWCINRCERSGRSVGRGKHISERKQMSGTASSDVSLMHTAYEEIAVHVETAYEVFCLAACAPSHFQRHHWRNQTSSARLLGSLQKNHRIRHIHIFFTFHMKGSTLSGECRELRFHNLTTRVREEDFTKHTNRGKRNRHTNTRSHCKRRFKNRRNFPNRPLD